MRKIICATLLILLLAGCARAPMPPETAPTQSAETAPTVPPTTAAEPTETATEPPSLPPESQPTEPEAQAEQIRTGYRYMLEREEMTWILSDRTWTTVGNLRHDKVLTLQSPVAFGAVYLEWNKTPGPFTLEWEGGSMVCGQEDFLHDYIRLPQSVTSVTFSLPEGASGELAELQLFTPGAAPEGVQDWSVPWETADILVFPTHADDDVFFFGPLIAYYTIEKDLAVQVAFLVAHDLQPIRCHERLNGLWALGVRNYPIIGPCADGGTGSLEHGLIYHRDSDIYGWQMEQIRRFRPLVILGHDLDGEYGSYDHKVNSYYLTQAVYDAAQADKDPASAEKYGLWDTPKVYLHLYPENSWLFDVNTPMAADPQGRSPIQVADEALDQHVSQGGEILTVWQEATNPGWDCRAFGLFKTLVGPDTGNDVMENLDPKQWR